MATVSYVWPPQSGTGGATEATLESILTENQAMHNDLDILASRTNTLGQQVMNGSISVAIASDQSTLPIALPYDTGSGTYSATTLRAVIATNQPTLPVQLTGTNSVFLDVGTYGLNYGTPAASLRVSSQIGNASGAANFAAGITTAQTLRVVIATDQTSIPAKLGGGSIAYRLLNAFTTSPVTTAAYVQLVASAASNSNAFQYYNDSGQTLVLATGAIGVEIDQFYLFPTSTNSGPAIVQIFQGGGQRLSIKAIGASATTGSLLINAIL